MMVQIYICFIWITLKNHVRSNCIVKSKVEIFWSMDCDAWEKKSNRWTTTKRLASKSHNQPSDTLKRVVAYTQKLNRLENIFICKQPCNRGEEEFVVRLPKENIKGHCICWPNDRRSFLVMPLVVVIYKYIEVSCAIFGT